MSEVNGDNEEKGRIAGRKAVERDE